MDERKSTSGYVFLMGGGPVSWANRKQESMSLSTMEAEYVSICEAAKEYLWYTNLMQELQADMPIKLFNDNASCVQLSHNGGFHKRTKHVALKTSSLRTWSRVEELS